jgi:hypothetical protein
MQRSVAETRSLEDELRELSDEELDQLRIPAKPATNSS